MNKNYKHHFKHKRSDAHALVEGFLRLFCGVQIHHIVGEQPAVVVVDGGLDNTISTKDIEKCAEKILGVGRNEKIKIRMSLIRMTGELLDEGA